MTLVMYSIRRVGWKRFAFALVFVCGFSTQSNAQQFGRFFTTPEERKHLEQLKRKKPAQVNVVDADDFTPAEDTETVAVEPPPVNRVTLKGLVYRKDGARTAWVNDSNTYEGDPVIAYMKLEEGDILHNNVTLELPVGGAPVKLKVGQSYDPQSGAVSGMMDQSSAQSGAVAGDEKDPERERR